jgi:phage I-like protein
MSRLATLHHALPMPAPVVAAGGAPTPPEWVHVLPTGTFAGVDGRGPYTVSDPQALIEASLPAGGKLLLDENHAFDLAAKKGLPSPALGWMVELQSRADGIWARMDWTRAGGARAADREYIGLSPVFAYEAGGRVTKLLRATLTNDPNLNLISLHHSETPMDLAKLRAALGLPADADEAAILAAVALPRADLVKLRTALGLPETADEAAVIAAAEAARTAGAARAAEVKALAEAAGVPEAKDLPAVTVALQARGATTEARSTELVALQSRVTELTNERARDRAVLYVDAAMKAGKPIVPSVREHYIARHMREPQAVESEVAAMPSLHMGGLGSRAIAEADAAGVSSEDVTVGKALGLDPKKLAAARSAA